MCAFVYCIVFFERQVPHNLITTLDTVEKLFAVYYNKDIESVFIYHWKTLRKQKNQWKSSNFISALQKLEKKQSRRKKATSLCHYKEKSFYKQHILQRSSQRH